MDLAVCNFKHSPQGKILKQTVNPGKILTLCFQSKILTIQKSYHQKIFFLQQSKIFLIFAKTKIYMDIKIVEKPVCQDVESNFKNDSSRSDIWIVNTTKYREKNGGIKRWFSYLKEMEGKGYDTVYLYDITALSQKIVNGLDESNWELDIVYYVRADFKKLKQVKS
jgi:hypothetical protein